MPDLRDAMRSAGFQGNPRQGRPGAETRQFPEGYPEYFTPEGELKAEYITTLAEEIARRLGNERPRMTMHQLRAFYGVVKRQEAALKNGRPFPLVHTEILTNRSIK
jgi:hypothetical protein